MPPLKLQFSDSPAIQIFGYQTTMPYIDITTMRGMMPGVIASMLPDYSAVLAENCHFRYGV
ncbi:hypothetical protein ACO2D6_005549, partial [Escherichia coli]